MLQYKHFKGVNTRVHVLDDTSELSKTFKKLNMKLQIVFNFQSWMYNKEIMTYIFLSWRYHFLLKVLFWRDSILVRVKFSKTEIKLYLAEWISV